MARLLKSALALSIATAFEPVKTTFSEKNYHKSILNQFQNS